MSKLKPREIILDTVGDSVIADTLHPQAVANHEVVPIKDERNSRAWAAGAAVVNSLVKTSDRRAINDQLWRYCAAPDDYPLELRTVYGGSDKPHSVEVLDWVLPSLKIAASMKKYGVSPKVSVMSADEASVRINGLPAQATASHSNDTLRLVEIVASTYYPAVSLEVGGLSWEDLTAEPYSYDVSLLRSRQLGSSVVKIVDSLEAMVSKKGGRVESASEYLGLHNTAYGIYSGTPTVKMAGVSEARFTVVQRALAEAHPDMVATRSIDGTPSLVAGVIQDTSATAPYYQQAGLLVPDLLGRINEHGINVSELGAIV